MNASRNPKITCPSIKAGFEGSWNAPHSKERVSAPSKGTEQSRIAMPFRETRNASRS